MSSATVFWEPSEREVRLNEIIYEYELAVDRGDAPDAQTFLAAHPDFANELQEYLQSRQDFQPSSTPRLGEQVGDYILLDRLGRGGEGTVYRAQHRLTDHVVALKVVKASAAAGARIQEETRVLSTLRHPNIVQPHFFGEDRGLRYFTMTLLEGGSLNDHLERYKADPKAAVALVQKIARAIHHAHSRGILHLDLKPANVLLDESGEPRVSDFGLAQRLRNRSNSAPVVQANEHATPSAPASSVVTATPPDDPIVTVVGNPVSTPDPLPASAPAIPSIPTGLPEHSERPGQTWSRRQIRGTAPYMSPEMASTDVTVLTTAADVYGLGAILYTLLTGRPPFLGQTITETLQLVVQDPPIPPRTLNPAVGRELQIVCLKCLAKDPAQRYGSADALANDLGRWLRREPTVAGGSNVGKQIFFWLRRHPASVLAAGVLFLIIWLAGIIGSLGELKRNTAADAASVARQVSAQFQMIQRAVGIVAREPELLQALANHADGSPAQRQALDAFLAKASAEFNFRFGIVGGNPLFNVFIMNQEGVLLADTFSGSTAVGRNFSQREYFQSVMGNDELAHDAVAISDVFRSVKDGLWKVPISTRIWAENGHDCLGVLVANVTVGSHVVAYDMHDAPPDAFVTAPIDWHYADPNLTADEKAPYLAILEQSYPREDQSMIWPEPDDFPDLKNFSELSTLKARIDTATDGNLLGYHRVGDSILVAVVRRTPPWPIRMLLAERPRGWLITVVTLAILAAAAHFLVKTFMASPSESAPTS